MTFTTTTIQPLSRASVENADNKDTTEAESNIRDILAVCDSLNKLHETLSKLDYAVKRKNMEKGLSEKKPSIPENNSRMKSEIKKIIILIVFVAVLLTVVSVLFLNLMLGKTVRNNIELIDSIADAQADYWQTWQKIRLTQVYDLANILEIYDGLPAESKHWLDNTLEKIIKDSVDIVTLYTVWKADAIDGMGQYIAEHSRENGQIEIIPAGSDAYLLQITAPIFNSHTNEVAGIVVCAYDLAIMQKTLEKLIAGNNIINAMEIYTNDGFIAASYVPGRIGKKLRNAEPIYNNMRMVLKPFTMGNVKWTVMAGATKDFVMRGMSENIRLTVMVAFIAIITASAAILIVFNIMIAPVDNGNNGGITTPGKIFFHKGVFK